MLEANVNQLLMISVPTARRYVYFGVGEALWDSSREVTVTGG